MLDQEMDQAELVERLRTLSAVLKDMTPDSSRQVLIWLKNVIKPQMGASMHWEVARIQDEINPWKVEKTKYNLQLTLEEMQKQALLKGKMEGKQEGIAQGRRENKLEVARAALREGFSVKDIVEITGLSEEDILKLKDEFNS